MSFWRRIFGTVRLAVLSQFEYRLNLVLDAIVQPVINAIVEVALWYAIFTSIGQPLLGGFGRQTYLVYALWATFFARIGVNWVYEFRMIDDVNTGRVNAILVRPISFYEYYLGQFIGYKMLTALISMCIPLGLSLVWSGPTQLSRLPLALALLMYYVLLVHTMSFAVASLAFFYNRIDTLTATKNISLWMLSGELFPLDLIPPPYREWVVSLPFCCGVYIPVAYLTGRIPVEDVYRGFVSVTGGLVVFGLLAWTLWQSGRRAYSGTGA
jgi:ABC-2 type transport system permease protein